MRKLVAVVLACAGLGYGALEHGACAQDAVAAAQAALVDALGQAPMSLPVVVFVTEQASGYGMYRLRGDNRFRPGEPMHVYVEPLAFKAKADGAEWSFGVTVDFAVLSKAGDTLVTREKFLDAGFHSHRRNTELMFNATVSLESAPPGDYQLELTVHDKASADIARARLPFTVE